MRFAQYVPFVPKRVVLQEDPLHGQKLGFTQPLDRVYGDFAPPLGLTILFSIEGDEITSHTEAAIQAIFDQTMLADAA